MNKTLKQIKEATSLYQEGFSLKEVSMKTGYSKSWVYRICKKSLIPIRKPGREAGYCPTEETRKKLSLSKTGEKSPRWKGDMAGYRAKHIWLARILGKPHFCNHCKDKTLSHRSYHWANISGRYKRNIKDWKRLCVRCHKKFDKK